MLCKFNRTRHVNHPTLILCGYSPAWHAEVRYLDVETLAVCGLDRLWCIFILATATHDCNIGALEKYCVSKEGKVEKYIHLCQ